MIDNLELFKKQGYIHLKDYIPKNILDDTRSRAINLKLKYKDREGEPRHNGSGTFWKGLELVSRFQRLRDYKRADLGISYVFTDVNKSYSTGWLSNFKELTAGLELFNMFDIQNSITNTWVRDVYSKRQYSIPNYLTPRLLNLTIDMKL